MGWGDAAEGLSPSQMTRSDAAESPLNSAKGLERRRSVPFESATTMERCRSGVVELFNFVHGALIRVVGSGGKQGFIGHAPLRPLHNRRRRIALSLPTVPTDPWRHYVTLPSVLAPAVKARIKELKRPSFSQHAIETLCFDAADSSGARGDRAICPGVAGDLGRHR
jgi:hypothetical protein